MTTAIDTNVIVALWSPDAATASAARKALDAALARGPLCVCAPVYAELLAAPGRSESFVEHFARETGIAVDWDLGEPVWRAAGRAFQAYASRRREHGAAHPRRILADFLIGAHALRNHHRLLTLDTPLYRSAFPTLRLEVP